MNIPQLNAAIAEVVGCKYNPKTKATTWDMDGVKTQLGEFTSDLNAVHLAEKRTVAHSELSVQYRQELSNLTCPWHATALQRSIALARVHNLLRNLQGSVHLCQQCGKNAAAEKHGCPFLEEIMLDSVNVCNCCKSCALKCAAIVQT